MSASELLDQALKLPPTERKAFAEQLWQSLEFRGDEQSAAPIGQEPDYVQEFRRRVATVQAGKYEFLNVAESQARAQKALAEHKR